MRSFLLILMLIIGLQVRLLAGTDKWPGIEYKSVKVYLYNLDDRLFGQHQTIKNDKLDSTIIQPGKSLTAEQVETVIKLSNENTNLLELGLSSCFLPHHAIVFFDANEKPVAYISICFMCDAARFFPAKKLNLNEVSNPKKEKVVLEQLDRLNQIVRNAGLLVLKTSPEYNMLSRIYKYPKADSLEIDFPGFTKQNVKSFTWAKQGFNNFSSCEGEKDSTVKIAAGGRHYYFFSIKTLNSEIRYSKGNQTFYPDYAIIIEDCFHIAINKLRMFTYRYVLENIIEHNNPTPANTNCYIIKDPDFHLKYSFRFVDEFLIEIKINMY